MGDEIRLITCRNVNKPAHTAAQYAQGPTTHSEQIGAKRLQNTAYYVYSSIMRKHLELGLAVKTCQATELTVVTLTSQLNSCTSTVRGADFRSR